MALDPPPERSAWTAVRTPHFVVNSDARPAKARDVALELERMVSALAQVVPLAPRSYQATEVYLFASDSEFEATCGAAAGRPCSRLAGLFLPGRYGDYVLVSGERSEQARAVACHELTHAFVRNSSPNIPLWLNEGLAEFWGSFSVVGKDVRIGRPDEDHLALLRRQGLLPLATVLGVTYESPEYNVPARRPAFYAQAWLLTHYLLLGKPGGRAMLGQYLARLQAGVDQEEAFRSAFGESSEQLNRDLYGYTQRSRMSAMSLPTANLAVAEPEKARPLSRDEALARLAQPIFDCPSCNPQACRPLLDEARRLNPKSQLANALLAALLGKAGSNREAAALFEEVTVAGASRALPLVLHQDFILNGPADQAAGGLAVDAAEVAHARELAQAALALEPDNVPALIGLGTSYLLAPREDGAPGVRALERALDLAPARSEAAGTLAQLLARSGQPARADEVVQRFVATSSDPRVRAQAPELLAAVALATANLAASEGRYDDAVKGFEAALAASRDPARRTTIGATIQRAPRQGRASRQRSISTTTATPRPPWRRSRSSSRPSGTRRCGPRRSAFATTSSRWGLHRRRAKRPAPSSSSRQTRTPTGRSCCGARPTRSARRSATTGPWPWPTAGSSRPRSPSPRTSRPTPPTPPSRRPRPACATGCATTSRDDGRRTRKRPGCPGRPLRRRRSGPERSRNRRQSEPRSSALIAVEATSSSIFVVTDFGRSIG